MNEQLRWILAKTLKNSKVLSFVYNSFFKIKNKRFFLKEVERRKQLSLFDYVALAKELPYYPIENVKDSNFYGYAYHIKKYAGIEKLRYSLEHGLYNDEYITPHNFLKTTKGILTFNQMRSDLLIEKTNKPSYAIGPYIHYADSLLNEEEMMSYKKELGKVLLFFPSHSTVELITNYNENIVIQKIKDIAKKGGFDTVVVCMYYYDILYCDYARLYVDSGFRIVTAGHRYDINFVSRLKSIIQLSDYVVANDFGTNIGYCVYLNKPYYIINDEVIKKRSGIFRLVAEMFTVFNDGITKEQYEICSKYWGFNSIKSKEELKSILQ